MSASHNYSNNFNNNELNNEDDDAFRESAAMGQVPDNFAEQQEKDDMFGKIRKIAKPDIEETLANEANLQDLINAGGSDDYFKSSASSHSAWLARHGLFEIATLTIIVFNGLWMGYDCDSNVDDDGKPTNTLADAKLRFVLLENFFCAYFTFEVLVRFAAFERKRDCLKDGWFKFDTILVSMMILETWITPIILGPVPPEKEGNSSGTGIFTILRLLRLMRLTRMVRLMRSVPELLTLLKGISTATKAVGSTLILLFLVLYVFAIIFRQNIGERSPDFYDKFGSLPLSAYTLFSAGTVVDNVSDLLYHMWHRQVTADIVAFFLYILFSSFTILNMLIGVLVEVVGSVSVGEKEKAIITTVADQLSAIFREIDVDGSGLISRMEFDDMVSDEAVRDNLLQIGIQPKHLALLSDALFEVDDEEGGGEQKDGGKPAHLDDDLDVQPEGKEITFVEFLKFVIQTRPQNPASVLDISQLRRYFCRSMEKVFRFIDLKCSDTTTRKLMVRKKIRKLNSEKSAIEDATVKREAEIIEYQREISKLRAEVDARTSVIDPK